MDHLSWTIWLIWLLDGAVFFSVHTIALRTFSPAKLLEALKSVNKENLMDGFVRNTEKMTLACALYQLIFNMLILLSVIRVFAMLNNAELHATGYLTALLAALAIFSVFSLAIPHAWAKYASEKILCRTYKILLFLVFTVRPILYILQLYDRLVRRLAGVAETSPDQLEEEKQDEFLTDLELQKMRGVVDEEEQEMIENVLQLSETTVGEIMTPRTDMTSVNITADIQTILETITTTGHSRLPIYEYNMDNVVGFIYAKDLLMEIGKVPADFKLKDKLRLPYFVPESKPLRELLHEFQDQKLHIAIVLDEYGGTAGIVSIEDILEELVGEITDEYEKNRPKKIVQVDRNLIEVDGRTYISDLNRDFELNLPEKEDYDTVAGFVFSYLGYIPKAGDSFDFNSIKFTIVSAEARRIRRIKIQKP